MQVTEVDQSKIQKPGVVYDIAQTDVEMAVHALQSTDNDAVFGCRHSENMSLNMCPTGVGSQRASDSGLLASLSQTSGMYLHQFGQSRDNEVPFVGQSVSPTAVCELGVEMGAHDFNDFGGVCVCIKIEITAQVGPMIERLNYRNRATAIFQSSTDLLQKIQ